MGASRPESLFFDTSDEFESWLDANGDASDGVWVKMAKKRTGIPSLDWKQGVEVALCYGWIDGQSRRIDDDSFIQRFAPRRPRSTWSKINREKVEALIAAGRIRPAGLAEVERADTTAGGKRPTTGWPRRPCPSVSPKSSRNAGLGDAFAALDPRNRYAILHQLMTAKRPQTRAQRIAKYVTMLGSGDKPYP